MDDEKWKTKYEQLNRRARLYSSQLWYVPFAYLGIIAVTLDKIPNLPQDLPNLRGFVLVFMGIFSIAVFVHISSIKYLERRAVKEMRKLEENDIISSGGGKWYLSFAWYIRLLLFVASYYFIAYGIMQILSKYSSQYCWVWIAIMTLTIFYSILIYKNHSLNKPLKDEIQ
jgi:hypothetical protein